jgi:hypothetical protein
MLWLKALRGMNLDWQLSQPWVSLEASSWDAIHHCCPHPLAPDVLHHAPYSAWVHVKDAAIDNRIQYTDCALPALQYFTFLVYSSDHYMHTWWSFVCLLHVALTKTNRGKLCLTCVPVLILNWLSLKWPHRGQSKVTVMCWMVNKMLLVLVTNVSYDYSSNHGIGGGDLPHPSNLLKVM